MAAGPDIHLTASRHVMTRRVSTVGTLERATLGVALVGSLLVCVAAFVFTPHLVDASVRTVIETCVAITALLTSVLLVLALRARPRMQLLLLLSAILSVALADVVFAVIPGISGRPDLSFGFDARLVLAAIVPIAFTAAALAPRTEATVAQSWRVGLISLGCVALVAAVEAVDLTLGRTGAGPGVPVWLTSALSAAEAMLLLAAAIAFVVRDEADEWGWLLAAVCVLLAATRVVSIAMGTIPGDWVTLRDPLRLVAYGLLCTRVAIERGALARRHEAEAVRSERARIARDLHDGLAQDLATIALHVRSLEQQYGDHHPLTIAARRALAASRGTIVDLSASGAPSTLAALRTIAGELQARFPITVTVLSEDSAESSAERELSAHAREHVVRIAREAIVNAARHGHAREIEVVLAAHGGHWTLRVTDDGQGLPEAVVRDGVYGFGLGAMHDRAAEAGGELEARRLAAGGTTVELTLPQQPCSPSRDRR